MSRDASEMLQMILVALAASIVLIALSGGFGPGPFEAAKSQVTKERHERSKP